MLIWIASELPCYAKSCSVSSAWISWTLIRQLNFSSHGYISSLRTWQQYGRWLIDFKIDYRLWSLKGLTQLGKSCQIYPNCVQNVKDVLLNMFVFFPNTNIAYFARYLSLEYLGLWRHLRCALYSTVLVLRQTIYGGRLLLVIAFVIATW